MRLATLLALLGLVWLGSVDHVTGRYGPVSNVVIRNGSFPEPEILVSDKAVFYVGHFTMTSPERVPPGRKVYLTSPGGVVRSAEVIGRQARQLVAMLECNSACAWLLVEADHACVESSVDTLYFHSIGIIKANFSGTERRVVLRVATRERVERLREPLRTVLKDLPLTNTPRPIPLEQFLVAYPEKSCAAKQLRSAP